MHAQVIFRVAGPDPALRFFEKNLFFAPEKTAHERAPLFGGKRPQRDGTALPHGHGNAVRAARGGRSRALRVSEDVRVSERIFRERAAGFVELRVGLAGKADHDVRADAHAGNARRDFADEREVFLERIMPAHVAQNAPAAALQRNVDERRQRVRGIVHAVENAVGNRLGLDAADAHAGNAGNGGDGVDDAENVVSGILIRADVHARERDFLRAARGEAFRFRDEIGKIAGTRAPTRERDDAVAAHEVAAVLHFEVGAQRRRRRAADRGNGKISRGKLAGDDQRNRALFPVADEIRQRKLVAVADDEVDARNPRERRRARLRIAADDGAERLRVRLDEAAHDLPALRFREPRHRAGIDDAEIRGSTPRNDFAAERLEAVAQRLRLGLVETAAQREQRRPPERERA